MKNYRVTLTLEGDPSEQGYVRLDAFINELSCFTEIAKRAEELVAEKNGQSSIYYRVVDLKRSSPSAVTLEACLKDPEYDIREPVHAEIVDTMQRLEKGEDIKGREKFYLINSIKHFVDPVGKKISKLNISIDKNVVYLDEKFKARVDIYVAPEETSSSYFTGMLDAINIHGASKLFYIYPLVGPTKIQCLFPNHLLEKAKASLGSRIKVTGQFKYKLNAPYPHYAEVEDIETFPPDDELPAFIDLLGIEPDLTNGASPEEYIRNIRNA
jgi:hypothetical protein